jgi:hypothetical protein
VRWNRELEKDADVGVSNNKVVLSNLDSSAMVPCLVQEAKQQQLQLLTGTISTGR